MTVGAGELEVRVSHDLGALGAEEVRPVFFQWRWYDNAPMLPLWLGLALLLTVPRQNRHWQAWTILALPLPAAALQLLFFVPGFDQSVGFDSFVQFTVTIAVAWSAVWLLVPYLPTRRRAAGFFSALAVMLAAGLTAYVGYFGAWVSMDQLTLLGFWCIGCLALLGGIMLSGVSCRGDYHPARIAMWLVLWLPLITAVCLVVLFGVLFLPMAADLGFALVMMMAVSALFSTVFMAGFLYAVNAPVLLLAGLTDCYGRRLQSLAIHERTGGLVSIDSSPAGTSAPVDDTSLEA